MTDKEDITSELLLTAYANGYFPMALSRDDPEIHWFHPDKRGILPLESFHIPRSLAKLARKHPFTITFDTAFPEIIAACAEQTRKREETWINGTIIRLYTELWKKGYAHSVECWQTSADGHPLLAGGLYGLALGGAFFGESMFTRAANASRIALVTLVMALQKAGYTLLDTQYVNDHLKQFGVVEIKRETYLEQLNEALAVRPQPVFLSSGVPNIIGKMSHINPEG